MLDFLFACGQLVCFAGLLYGAYLVIRHGETFESLQKPKSGPAAESAAAAGYPYWRDYMRYYL